MFTAINTALMLEAYHHGVFPMAESGNAENYNFYRPKMRALIPLNPACCPNKLRRLVQKFAYDIRINHDFEAVIQACAMTKKGREETWINEAIIQNFLALHTTGHAHCIEVYDNNTLIGGLYGLALGQVFCGESMFSKENNTSKIALIHLCARLKYGGFKLLDAQYHNPHLEQFGLYEIPQEEYEKRIQIEMAQPADFLLKNLTEQALIKAYFSKQSKTQTS